MFSVKFFNKERTLIGSLLTILFLMFCCYEGIAEIKLPAIINEGMVLQQNDSVPIWGWAKPKEEIEVIGSWGINSVRTVSKSDGKFMVEIKTPQAGGPYSLIIQGSNDTVHINNVMVGEVWLASGQSNMEMPVSGWPGAPILDSDREIKQAECEEIRLFHARRNIALTPQTSGIGEWKKCSTENVGSFSATAYFFARELYKELKVPIGLIEVSWGGTEIEAWSSKDVLSKFKDFDSILEKIEPTKANIENLHAEYERQKKSWEAAVTNIKDEYASITYDDREWRIMELPTLWEESGHPDLDGIVWFRKKIKIDHRKKKDLKINLGPIDENDVVWFNSERIGSTTGWTEPRLYDIPENIVKEGENLIAIRVIDEGGNGGFYGDVKGMKIFSDRNSTEKGISIEGNWKYKISYELKIGDLPSQNPNTPTALFNGMIAPLIPFAIRGAIWYQGESNVGNAERYSKYFPLMIKDWRNKWGRGSFPFYFVQIAPYRYGGGGKNSAKLRDAQRTTLRLPNTGMAVTLDIGDNTNIHPSNKQEVGRRLALWALAKTYDMDEIVFSGPLYDNIEIIGSKAILSFKYAESGLTADGEELNSFEIADENGHFVSAEAKIKENKVEVSSKSVIHPKAVRYGWKDTPEVHLYNKAGLPASSFNTQN